MIIFFIKIITTLSLFSLLHIAKSIEVDEPIDLENPIDVAYQGNPPSLNKDRDFWPKHGSLVLYDDPRDELRRREGVINHNNNNNNNKKSRDFWINNANDSRRRRINRKLMDKEINRPNIADEHQRERDRIDHSRPDDIEHKHRHPVNLQRPLDDFVNRRIQNERQEEINREVKKALRRKEDIFEDITLEKRRRMDREKHARVEDRREKHTRVEDRREKHTRVEGRREILPKSNRLGENIFAKRRGILESSFERSELERRERLSQIEDQQRRNIKRNINVNERVLRDRERNFGNEKLNWKREEEKLREIEKRRRQEILNEEFIGVSNSDQINKRFYNDNKPPILIYETVPVPIPVNIKDYDEYNDDVSFSKLYDAREADNSFLDRRPHESFNNDVHVKEKITVEDLPSILGVSSVLPIDQSIGSDLAFAIGASELETLNQAAAIADINALAQLQHVAALENIHAINAINNQVALNQLHGAAVLSTANAIGQVANAAAVADHTAKIHAVKTNDALISQSLLNRQLVDAAVVEDHVAKAQKVDFLNLVFKHGLRDALREQLKLHLRSKVEEEAFIHDLQVTKGDLLTRLTLLRPYFKSPSQAGFILPAFIPNIPVGFDVAAQPIAELSKIPLLPTTLLAPDFRLPPEISIDLKDKIDIAFVEHILRLPEHIFYKVVHLPKKEFIITLFPTLFRETVKHLKYDPIEHYKPNTPHDHIVKEHHHHHLHVHQPPIDHKPDILHHPHPITDHGHPKSHEIPVDPIIIHPPVNPLDVHNDLKEISDFHNRPLNSHEHIFNGPNGVPHGHLHPLDIHEKHNVILPFGAPHKEVHIVRHPAQLPIVNHPKPNIDHPRLQIPLSGNVPFKFRPQHSFPQGSPLPLEKSSYSDYNSREQFFNQHVKENSRETIITPRPIFNPTEEVPYPPLISPHPVKGINIRHKGEEGHEIVSTSPPPILISTTLVQDSLEEHDNLIRFPNSGENFQFKQLVSNNFRSVRLNNNIIGTTITPFDSNEIGHSTLRPKKIDLSGNDNGNDESFSPVTLPVDSFSTTHIPFTSNNPTTLLPFFSTFNNINTDIDKNKKADEEDQAIEILTNKDTISSTISSLANAIDSDVSPFRGFSGNVRQKPLSERLNPEIHSENSLNWIPGTDINDDSHLASFFQKKKGNATHGLQGSNQADNTIFRTNNFKGSHSTESVVNKVKRITNFFGTRLQEGIPNIQLKSTNQSAFNPFFHRNFNSLNDHIKSSSPIMSSKQAFHQNTELNIPEFSEILKLSTSERDNSALPPFKENKKVPMPRRIDLSIPPINTKLHVKRLTLPPQGPIKGQLLSFSRNPGSNARSQAVSGQNTFAGISVQGLENIPSFLREQPLCSILGNANRSFCIYPEGYESGKASQMVKEHEADISKLLQILNELPKPNPDLNEAAKQIPNLNLSVSCETEERNVKLSWSKDILGSWLSILQTEPFEQYTTVVTCGDRAREKGCRPLLQPRPFVAFHPRDENGKPYIMEFPLPVGCVYAEA